jgi:hypothetical protein
MQNCNLVLQPLHCNNTKSFNNTNVEQKNDKQNTINGYEWNWLSDLIFYFFFFFVILWIILYSLSPPLLQNTLGQVDTAKVLIASLIITLIIVVALGILKYVVNQAGKRNTIKMQLEKCINVCNEK